MGTTHGEIARQENKTVKFFQIRKYGAHDQGFLVSQESRYYCRDFKLEDSIPCRYYLLFSHMHHVQCVSLPDKLHQDP